MSLGPVWPLMQLLLAAVGLVLLIACGNAANLLLARATERSAGTRRTDGAGCGRGRMVRQLLTESLLIGAADARWELGWRILFLRLLPRLDPGNIPRLNEASLDWRVLLVAVGAALFTSVVAGLLPAWRASRMELTEFLKSHGARAGSRGHSRVQSGLIVAQTAMVVCVTGRGRAADSELYQGGERRHGFLAVDGDFHLTLDGRYKKPQQHWSLLSSNLMARLDALPGVHGSRRSERSATQQFREHRHDLGWTGYQEQGFSAGGRSTLHRVFEAMSIPLIAGRYFQ